MYRIAIVGAGAIGKIHADAILKNKECRIVAVADIAIQRANEIATEHNALSFSDYKKMCEDVKIDAVIINLPHYLHYEASMFFIEKGIHILLEKPMAMNVRECDELIKAANKHNVKLSVGHPHRYFSSYRKLKKIIEEEKLGKLCMITETRNVDYLSDRPKWFLKKEMSGGGIVMNYGVHSLDKIMYTTGQKVKNIFALTSNPISTDDVEINAQILLEMADGVTAAVTYCGCHIVREYEVSFYFTDGSVKITDNNKLKISEGGKYKEYEWDDNIFEMQIVEFVKLLNNQPSEIATAQFGRDIISVIERIV